MPFVDNWATCDGLRPKCFAQHRKDLFLKIQQWIISDQCYTVRFAIEMLLVHFLDLEFDSCHLEMVKSVRSREYYIQMMQAWYFATALAKQWEHTIRFLERYSLEHWVHNKTIQKAVESNRISQEQKIYLRSLRV